VRRVAELFPIIEATRVVMETFAGLKVDLERAGQRLDDFDLIIASTALVLNYRLVTNNEKHFKRIPGLHIENWARTK
jgi:tRNA(fMet)-specific endonuclease VapC